MLKPSEETQQQRKQGRKMLCRIVVSRCQLFQFGIGHRSVTLIFGDLHRQRLHTPPSTASPSASPVPSFISYQPKEFKESFPTGLVRGGDTEWKISAQVVEVHQSYNGQTRGEGYGENCQVPPAWPGSV